LNRRLPSIDWARGLAVLLMIEAHTFDAWTRAADRETLAFRDATILGGFAAPLFLLLAGVSVPLAVARARDRGRARWVSAEGVVKRGLEIFLLAFLFRLQAFIVSPGSHPIAIFRVDILNVMGPAIAAAALVMSLRISETARAAIYSSLAAAFAMLTPIVRTASAVRALPLWFQWYLRPAGEHTTFTLFPWAGFVFAGAVIGVAVVNSTRRTASPIGSRVTGAFGPAVRWLAVSGALLVGLGWTGAMRPSIYAESSFWTSSPTWFAIRVGIIALALAALASVERWASVVSALTPFERLGRHSLFVYWIHVELVYGYASWMWKGRLPIWGTTVGYCAFCVVMYGAVVLKTRAAGLSRPRPARGPEPQTAAA